jgi:hypothetical protein
MLAELQEELQQDDASLALAEVHGQVRDLLQAEGLSSRIPGIVQRMRVASLIGQREHTLLAS